MGFGVGLFQQREPGFIGVSALRKVQSAAARLIRLAVNFLCVLIALDFIPKDAVKVAVAVLRKGLVVVWFDEVELFRSAYQIHGKQDRRAKTNLVVNDLTEPLAIAMEHKPIHAHIRILSYADPLNEARLVAQGTQSSHQPTVAVMALTNIVRARSLNEKLGVIKNFSNPLDRLGFEVGTRPTRATPCAIPICKFREPRSLGPLFFLTTGSLVLSDVPSLIRNTTQVSGSSNPSIIAGYAILRVAVRRVIVVVFVITQRLETVAAASTQVEVEVEVWVTVLLVHSAALTNDLGDFGLAKGGCFLIRPCRRRGLASSEVFSRGAFGKLFCQLILGKQGNGFPNVSNVFVILIKYRTNTSMTEKNEAIFRPTQALV
jgi:hypothetical protein